MLSSLCVEINFICKFTVKFHLKYLVVGVFVVLEYRPQVLQTTAATSQSLKINIFIAHKWKINCLDPDHLKLQHFIRGMMFVGFG